ncbi:hypothetical protein [Burkholderia phage FLC9]|nr:hypothetical protein [Burkholderia phage FLC9]
MKIVPQYSLENAQYFTKVPGAVENETVTAGRSVLSAPLVFGKGIPFLEMAKTDLLLEENVIDSKWTIDPERARLETISLVFKGLGKVVNTNIGLNVEESYFRPGSANKPHLVTIIKKSIPLVVGMVELVTWTTPEERAGVAGLEYIVRKDLYVRFELGISGSINLADGRVSVFDSQLRVDSIMDSQGRALDPAADPELTILERWLGETEAVGFYVDANWLQTDEAKTYQYELGDPNPIGRGVALLVRSYLLSVPSVGYAAEVTEPSVNQVGSTKLYLQPDRESEPEWYVTIEEGFELPPGECNIRFHVYGTTWTADVRDAQNETVKRWYVRGAWENIAPDQPGRWVEAIAQFLLDGEEYYLTNTLPDTIPTHSGHQVEAEG